MERIMAHALRPRGVNMKLILFLLAFLFLTAPALADVFDAPCSTLPRPQASRPCHRKDGIRP